MAEQAEISKFTIINIRKNERPFGTINVPYRIGQKRTVIPPMITALATTFLRSPVFTSTRWLCSCGFEIMITTISIRGAVVAADWFKKAVASLKAESGLEPTTLFTQPMRDSVASPGIP